MSIPTERNPAVPWFLDWFSASVKQGERTLAEHDLGERWTELLMFVSAVRNARRSAGAVLGENHPLVSGFDAACVDLKNLRDMLEHHEEYIFGQGKLQKPRKEAQLPHRFNLMISGGNGSHALSILVQTSDEADSPPQVFSVDVLKSLGAAISLAEAVLSEGRGGEEPSSLRRARALLSNPDCEDQ